MNKFFTIKDNYRHYILQILGIKISISKKGYKKFVPPKMLKGVPIITDIEAGNDCIYNKLKDNHPIIISRYGCVELETIEYYIKNKDINGSCIFPQYIKDNMRNQTGFFSPSDYYLSLYSSEILKMFKNVDILGVQSCFSKNGVSEEILFDNCSNKISIILLGAISPCQFHLQKPWNRILENKKVLVIHPFQKSIINQYKYRSKLFKNNLILPQFKLETIKSVQGIDTINAQKEYDNWFNALEKMYKDIDNKDFDIALIGAGAFGNFLANYIKEKGKQAIVVGGALQLFFGIKGERWSKEYINFYNDYWTKPLPEESPSDLTNFIRGEKNKAYW